MSIDLRICDAREGLADLPDRSVNCVVTSPPYWGLRDYGLEPVVWGGESGCGHEWEEESIRTETTANVHWQHAEGGATGKNRFSNTGTRTDSEGTFGIARRGFCAKCNAWRGSLGLEPTPELYVEHLVSVFREVRRVLRDDGTVWLNLGDSYANDGKWGGKTSGKHANGLHGEPVGRGKRNTGLKPKDLVGIPWRVAFALQTDGWYLRSDIIWSKPNPMPESVRDRPTKAHEYLFLLSKSQRYYYDWEAVAEAAKYAGYTISLGAKSLSRGQAAGANVKPSGNGNADSVIVPDTRNRRSVWTIPTAPYPEAHFATFPPALVEPCILAGCPEGGTVLDPFAGSGTVGQVAQQFHCNAILIEAQPKYRKMIEKRVKQAVLPLGAGV